MKHKLLQQLREYGGLAFILIAALVSTAISYGSSQATASITFANHESRISTLEKDDKDLTNAVAKMQQHIDDLWHDNGHREQ